MILSMGTIFRVKYTMKKLSAYQPYIRGNQGGAGRPGTMECHLMIADISIDKVGEYYDLLESRLASVIDMEQTMSSGRKRGYTLQICKSTAAIRVLLWRSGATPWNMRRFSFS